MSSFAQSTSGRLFTLGLSLALLGGGAVALFGGTVGIVIFGVALLQAVLCGIVGAAEGIERSGPVIAISLIVLPWLLYFFVVGSFWMMNYHPDYGYLLVAAGLGGLAWTLCAGNEGFVPRFPRDEAHAH